MAQGTICHSMQDANGTIYFIAPSEGVGNVTTYHILDESLSALPNGTSCSYDLENSGMAINLSLS